MKNKNKIFCVPWLNARFVWDALPPQPGSVHVAPDAADKQKELQKLSEAEEALFGQPGEEGRLAREFWERVTNTEKGYPLEVKRIMLGLQKSAGKLFQAMAKDIRERGAITEGNHQKLRNLNEFVRMVQSVGESVKMRETPYIVKGAAGPKSKTEVMQHEELVFFSKFAEQLEHLDPEEMIAMVAENRLFTDMLLQLQWKRTGAKPETEVIHEKDEKGNPILMLDRKNPDYKHSLEHLRRFILGKPTPMSGEKPKEKSEQRRLAELPLWIEIVRNMDFFQKRDLVAQFMQAGTPAEGEEFVLTCVQAGIMAKYEAQELYHEGKHWEAAHVEAVDSEKRKYNYPVLFSKFSKGFPKSVAGAVEKQKEYKEDADEAIRQMREGSPGNFLNENITFDNLIMSRVIDWGVITATANVFFDICDRVRQRKERGESMGTALAKGLGDTLTNWRTHAGFAAALGGIDYVFGGELHKGLLYGQTSAEKEALAQDENIKKLRDLSDGHRDVDLFFISNFEKLQRKAAKNGEEGHIDPVTGEKLYLAILYPDDVEVSDSKAAHMGFSGESADGKELSAKAKAQNAVVEMFRICTQNFADKEINNKQKLAKFFEENVYYNEPK